jgi:CBS-domain-containing membrane protein
MFGDGIVLVEERNIRVHRTTGALLPRGLLVRDVMTTSPISVDSSAGLREVASVLVRSEFDAVPVTDRRGRLLGMITQDKLVTKAGMHAKPAVLASLWRGTMPEEISDADLFSDKGGGLKAADVMTRGLPSTGPDAQLGEAVRVMAKGNLKRLPVIDRGERLVGMLARIDVLRVASSGSSRREILKRYGAGVASTTPVGRASLLEVPTVSPDAAAETVMDLIDAEGQRVVVVDGAGRPLGVVSDRDLLPLLDPKNKNRAGELTAASLMRTVPTVTQNTGVEEALDWMVEHRRKRLPVVNGEGRYIGMLSREELLRILAPEPEVG